MSQYHQFKEIVLEAIKNGDLTVEEIQEIASDVSYVVYGKKLQPAIMTKPKVKAAAST